jgi:predicted HTH domain antitoxin
MGVKSGVGSECLFGHLKGMKIEADFPDITESAAATEPEQGRKIMVEMACILYQKEIASFGQARRMTGMDVIEFQGELMKRGIHLHYTQEMLAQDIAYAQGHAGHQ